MENLLFHHPQPSKHAKSVTLGRLVSELRPVRGWLVVGTIALVMAAPASLFHPLVWMFVVDVVIMRGAHEWLVPALLVMLLVHTLSLILGAVRDRCYEQAGLLFTHGLRRRLFERLTHQTLSFFHRRRSGDLQARVISDVDNLQSSLLSGLTNLAGDLVTFILVMAAVWSIQWQVALLTIVPLTVAYWLVLVFNERIKRHYLAARRALGDLGARLQDALGGIILLQAFSRQENECQAFEKDSLVVLDRSMDAVRLRTVVFPTVFFSAFLTNVIMLGLGAWLVIKGQFTLGGLIAFRGYWWQLNAPVRTLAQVNDLVQRALAAATRIYELLDEPVELKEPAAPAFHESPRQDLTLHRVTFGYQAGRPIVRNLSLRIPSGQCTALAGPSGCGKTTLLMLMARFYDPWSGSVLLGSYSLAEIGSRAWHQHLALVTQETFLFNGTVWDNLLLGRPDADQSQVREACRRAHALEFILKLPQGFQTVVGERGIRLSGGQRQRLGMARAFLRDPEWLFLDEPTSSVEAESEAVIQESLLELMRGRTVVLTSHRPSLLAQADQVIVLGPNGIEEHGTHTHLMRQQGVYARMIRRWELLLQGERV